MRSHAKAATTATMMMMMSQRCCCTVMCWLVVTTTSTGRLVLADDQPDHDDKNDIDNVGGSGSSAYIGGVVLNSGPNGGTERTGPSAVVDPLQRFTSPEGTAVALCIISLFGLCMFASGLAHCWFKFHDPSPLLYGENDGKTISLEDENEQENDDIEDRYPMNVILEEEEDDQLEIGGIESRQPQHLDEVVVVATRVEDDEGIVQQDEHIHRMERTPAPIEDPSFLKTTTTAGLHDTSSTTKRTTAGTCEDDEDTIVHGDRRTTTQNFDQIV
jgi:hypothetical protein